jgi:glycine oxidase
LALASVKLLPELSDELRQQTGTDIGLNACGTLRIATSHRQAETQQKRLPKQQRLGLNLHWLPAEDVRKLEPAISDEVMGAIYGPDEAQLSAAKLVKAYAEGARHFGASLVTDNVIGLQRIGSQITGVKTAATTMSAKTTVLANGAWAPLAAEWLNVTLPIVPERGQIVTATNVKQRLRHIVFGEQIYLAPKPMNRVVIGASKDNCGYDTQNTLAGITQLLTRGMLLAPALAGTSLISTSVGLRPRTPDGCPIIGPVPGLEGITFATGHNSNGLLLSAITGQIIAAQLINVATSIDSSQYSIERFLNQAKR